jgi:hypothetical protein
MSAYRCRHPKTSTPRRRNIGIDHNKNHPSLQLQLLLQSHEKKQPMKQKQLEYNQQSQHLSMSTQQNEDYKTKDEKT